MFVLIIMTTEGERRDGNEELQEGRKLCELNLAGAAQPERAGSV